MICNAMRRNFLIGAFVLALIGISASCVSTFRNDAVDPRLPEYSQSGRNVAGALIDGHSWRARRGLDFFFIFPTGVSRAGNIHFYHDPDSTHNLLVFEYGEMNIDGLIKNVSVGFFLGDFLALEPDHLHSLRDRTISLDGHTNWGQLFLERRGGINGTGPDSLHRGIGNLHIRHVRDFRDSDSLIVSGTFGFDVAIDGKDHTVYSGRFDYVVGRQDFYTYF